MAIREKSGWTLFLLILVGIVLGSFLGNLLQQTAGFSWLSYGLNFGFSPVTLDLHVLTFTIGLTVNINIASILGVCLAIFIYRKL